MEDARDEGELRYLHLRPGDALPAHAVSRPYKALVIIEDDVTPEWRGLVSRWLVDTGCLSMSAWGRACSAWEDSVTDANLEDFDFGDVPDERFVMATWHDDEPIDDALFYVKYLGAHPSERLVHVLIVHIVPEPREDDVVAEYRRAD